jgi:hypothetical protein
VTRVGIGLASILALVGAGCGANVVATVHHDAFPGAAKPHCPHGVMFRASQFAPVARVLSEAQRALARNTINSQGRIYRLSPTHAPIDLVEQVRAVESRENVGFNRLIPGALAIERTGAAECGAQVTNASWAVHYGMPESIIANTGVYTFMVETRRGWRFWGDWCAAGRTKAWRRKHCVF